jgi:hypothetical protein
MARGLLIIIRLMPILKHKVDFLRYWLLTLFLRLRVMFVKWQFLAWGSYLHPWYVIHNNVCILSFFLYFKLMGGTLVQNLQQAWAFFLFYSHCPWLCGTALTHFIITCTRKKYIIQTSWLIMTDKDVSTVFHNSGIW